MPTIRWGPGRAASAAVGAGLLRGAEPYRAPAGRKQRVQLRLGHAPRRRAPLVLRLAVMVFVLFGVRRDRQRRRSVTGRTGWRAPTSASSGGAARRGRARVDPAHAAAPASPPEQPPPAAIEPAPPPKRRPPPPSPRRRRRAGPSHDDQRVAAAAPSRPPRQSRRRARGRVGGGGRDARAARRSATPRARAPCSPAISAEHPNGSPRRGGAGDVDSRRRSRTTTPTRRRSRRRYLTPLPARIVPGPGANASSRNRSSPPATTTRALHGTIFLVGARAGFIP